MAERWTPSPVALQRAVACLAVFLVPPPICDTKRKKAREKVSIFRRTVTTHSVEMRAVCSTTVMHTVQATESYYI